MLLRNINTRLWPAGDSWNLLWNIKYPLSKTYLISFYEQFYSSLLQTYLLTYLLVNKKQYVVVVAVPLCHASYQLGLIVPYIDTDPDPTLTGAASGTQSVPAPVVKYVHARRSGRLQGPHQLLHIAYLTLKTSTWSASIHNIAYAGSLEAAAALFDCHPGEMDVCGLCSPEHISGRV